MLRLSLGSLLLLACGKSDRMVENSAYDTLLRRLVPQEAPVMSVAKAAKREDLTYLDARARAEYEVSHLPQARWIGYEAFDSSRVVELDREQPLLIYCSVGYRSGKIAERLQNMGFQKVYNLYGGIFEWVNQGHPVQNLQQQPTDSVHGYSRTWGIWVKEAKVVY